MTPVILSALQLHEIPRFARNDRLCGRPVTLSALQLREIPRFARNDGLYGHPVILSALRAQRISANSPWRGRKEETP